MSHSRSPGRRHTGGLRDEFKPEVVPVAIPSRDSSVVYRPMQAISMLTGKVISAVLSRCIVSRSRFGTRGSSTGVPDLLAAAAAHGNDSAVPRHRPAHAQQLAAAVPDPVLGHHERHGVIRRVSHGTVG